MKTVSWLVVVGLVLLLSPGGHAAAAGEMETWDGRALLERCRSATRFFDAHGIVSSAILFDAGYCVGLASGIFTTHAAGLKRRQWSAYFCPPPAGVNEARMVRIIVRYLETHPELLHLYDADLVIEAFRAAFPCPP
jgi:hypothetical protein